ALFCDPVFGTELEMTVKPGDNVSLYCDRAVTFGSNILWMRNSSHKDLPFLEIDPLLIFSEKFPRFSFFANSSSNSHDLHIANVSVSDEGTYYCVKKELKITEKNGITHSKHEVEYGILRIRLFVADPVSVNESTAVCTHPPECALCWTLLLSVCPVCLLLSSFLSFIAGYYICGTHGAGT
ncbi:hypothetical protein DNTS_013337, partial [Danionella cerebrum]